ncbi:hypothetical protein [Streptomyces sp. FxanaA7]|uniref:hypothetical protein n=1 Tax=Streptomyces sp. FxanaA7 TaxID=1265492 RepID=UPI000A5951C3|nr:hypothetical protein [Streptomyces sp. FxanaA7]
MTSREFTQQHGDPATWSTADIEAQQNLAAIDALPDFTLLMLLPDPDPTPAA